MRDVLLQRLKVEGKGSGPKIKIKAFHILLKVVNLLLNKVSNKSFVATMNNAKRGAAVLV